MTHIYEIHKYRRYIYIHNFQSYIVCHVAVDEAQKRFFFFNYTINSFRWFSINFILVVVFFFSICIGRAFCICPLGWTLDLDWKTCIDIDECSDARTGNTLCPYGCENTLGSYKCVTDFESDEPANNVLELTTCPNGYEFNSDTQDCEGTILLFM